jgi:hypothetical protein
MIWILRYCLRHRELRGQRVCIVLLHRNRRYRHHLDEDLRACSFHRRHRLLLRLLLNHLPWATLIGVHRLHCLDTPRSHLLHVVYQSPQRQQRPQRAPLRQRHYKIYTRQSRSEQKISSLGWRPSD